VLSYASESTIVNDEIQAARDLLPRVSLPDEVARRGLAFIDRLQIDSLRAEITLFETARAFAAADGRESVTVEDLREVAPLALRVRRSNFMTEYFNTQQAEETEITSLLDELDH
jgi:magnesium chelatase subunit I